MRNLSSAWKEKVWNGMDVNYLKYADITLKDGTVLNLTNKDFWENGMEFEDSVSSDESFDIGSAIINKLTLTINNFDGQYSEYDFEDASVICYVGLETESPKIEKKRICTMAVVEQPENETVTIGLVCEDNMRKFDKDYSLSKLKYPATRAQIVRDACSVCGVILQTQIFDRSDYIVQVRPSDEALTFRQVLQWVAQIGCQWMRCDEYGRLCIGWYKSINEGTLVLDENGVLTSPDRDIIIANETASVENGSFIECNGVLKLFLVDKDGNISQMPPTYSFTPQHTDVVITGVRVTEYSDSLDDDAASYISGKEGYVLDISENKLIGKGDGETVAAMIAEKCVGMLFRPFEAECVTDVSLEAGDSVVIVDRNGKRYTSFVTSTVLSPGNGQSIACNAKSAAKNSSVQYSQETQAFVAARNMIKKEKSERERALEEFKERMDKATGLYSTIEVQEDGSKIYYLHDKPTLAESQAVWKMTAEAWGVSTDGGQTWNGGMTVDGDTIVRILNAVGINADWINAGAITVTDADGNIIFSVDMDTKSVYLDGSVQIGGGKSLNQTFANYLQESKDYSDGKLSNYAETVTGSLGDLQDQIDGQIETFYYDYEPTLQNKPASGWTSAAERKKHIGDLFFNKTTGYAYRFMQDGATWGWTLVQDTDITKAMKAAENAQDTADHKRRVFVTKPQPPYDIGDLWSQSEDEGGDILTCTVSRAKGASYVQSDWQKLNKYTDDTKAEEALEAASLARNMTMQLDNDYQGIPVDSDGNYTEIPECTTTATVMYGTQDITDNCTYTITTSQNIQGSWDKESKTYTVTGLTADSGWVDIRAVYLNNLAVTKRFSIAKQYAGAQGEPGTPGRTYFLRANAELLLMGADKKISPATLTVSALYRDGQEEEKNLHGYWKVEKSTDSGSSWNEVSISYTTAVKTINVAVNTMSLAAHDMLRVSVYSDAEKTILCDRQSFSVAIDVAALTQEDIVDILSNDGSWKGLYYLDGHLYISFDAAKGGTLILGGKNNGDGTQILYDANGKRVSKSDNDGTLYYKTYTDENNYTGFLFNKNGISFVEWVKGVETITPGIINFTADRTYINNNVYVYGWEGKARRKPVTSAGDAGSRIDYIGTGTGTTGGKEYRRVAIRGQWGSTTENYYATDYVYTNTGVSDIRLKENVKDSKVEALETVNRMKVRQFDWKKGGHQNIGFVADELEEIDPNLALGGGYDENGEMDVKQINTSYLLNYAIKAIQELSATVKEQGCKIRELEEKLDGIKGN